MALTGLSYLGHGTVLVEIDGLRILTDPILVNRLAFLLRVAPRPDPADASGIDLVLISHLHLDHLERGSLAMVGADVPVLIGRGGGDLVRGWGHSQVTELVPGDTAEVGAGLRVTATPAAHAGDRPPRGPRGTALGYLLETGDVRLYFAGDTDLFPEMADIGNGGLDAALLPIAGWGPRLGPGHLNAERAVEAARILNARQVLPIHWGTLWPAAMHLVGQARLAKPGRDFQRALAEQAPAVQSLLVEPGQRVGFRE